MVRCPPIFSRGREPPETDPGWAGQGRAGQGRAGQGRAGLGWAGLGWAGCGGRGRGGICRNPGWLRPERAGRDQQEPGLGPRSGPREPGAGAARSALARRRVDTRMSPSRKARGAGGDPPRAGTPAQGPDRPLSCRLSGCETEPPSHLQEKKIPHTLRVWRADWRLLGGARLGPEAPGSPRPGRARHLAAAGSSAAPGSAPALPAPLQISVPPPRPAACEGDPPAVPGGRAGGREEMDA